VVSVGATISICLPTEPGIRSVIKSMKFIHGMSLPLYLERS
jgi:hypothetical protein